MKKIYPNWPYYAQSFDNDEEYLVFDGDKKFIGSIYNPYNPVFKAKVPLYAYDLEYIINLMEQIKSDDTKWRENNKAKGY